MPVTANTKRTQSVSICENCVTKEAKKKYCIICKLKKEKNETKPNTKYKTKT